MRVPFTMSIRTVRSSALWKALHKAELATFRTTARLVRSSAPRKDTHGNGRMVSAACLEPLFDGKAKYESCSGSENPWQALPGPLAPRPISSADRQAVLRQRRRTELRTAFRSVRSGPRKASFTNLFPAARRPKCPAPRARCAPNDGFRAPASTHLASRHAQSCSGICVSFTTRCTSA